MSNEALPEDSWKALAKSLAVDPAVLKAVAAVEAAGSGFLPKIPQSRTIRRNRRFSSKDTRSTG